MGRRKVKKQNIVRETDTERRAKQQAQSDLAFAQQLRGSRDELIEKLTSQDTEAEIGGIASADKAIGEAQAGVGGYDAATNIGTSAQLASNAVATMTGVKDVSTELEGGRLATVAGMLGKEKEISTKAGLQAAGQEASQDITKFQAGEAVKSAKRGAMYSTLQGFAGGAMGAMQANVADTGSPFFRSAVVEGDAGKIVEGTQLQKGDAYQVGIFGGTRLGSLRAPAIVDATQTGQTTKTKIDPFNIGSMS
jgi:hypothetical protein